MEIEKIRKLKAELETDIKELLLQFEVKTGLCTQIMNVKINTASDRFAKQEAREEKELKIEGFGDFTIIRDTFGFRDVQYKGETVKGVSKATIKAYSQDKDYAVLELEIMENEQKTPDNRIG